MKQQTWIRPKSAMIRGDEVSWIEYFLEWRVFMSNTINVHEQEAAPDFTLPMQ